MKLWSQKATVWDLRIINSITKYYNFLKKDVPKVSKLYFPQIAQGFESPKLNLYIGDGFEYLKTHLNEYDVIITDSSDPGKYI